MFNLTTSRFGQNRPMCNNRHYGTIGLVKQLDEMKLEPEYLGNDHFKFLNNFGLPENFNSNKKFVEINNHVNHNHNLNRSKCRNYRNHMATESSRIVYNSTPDIICAAIPNTNFYHGYDNSKGKQGSDEDHTQMKNKNPIETVTNQQFEEDTPTPTSNYNSKNCNIVGSSSMSMKLSKKNKRNNKALCDKGSQKYCKRFKRHFNKQSKKETDRSVINKSTPGKRRNKSKNRKHLNIDIVMDADELDGCSKSDQSIESFISGSSSPVKINMKFNFDSSIDSNNSDCDAKQLNNQMDHSIIESPLRSRLPSECESEDSFIIFEGSENCDLNVYDDDEEDTDVYSTSSTSSSDETDDCDVVDFCRLNGSYQNVDSSDTESFINDIGDFGISDERRSIKTSSPVKKVRFVEGKDLCMVHPMIQWSFAYQKARKGPWEQYALDRMRFKNRISRVEPVLDVILHPLHRDKIFKERFQDDGDNCM